MDFDFEFDTGELQRIVKKLPDKMQDRIVRNANAAGARVIKKAARQLAPYDDNRSSGTHLRDGIIIKRIKNHNDYIVGTQTRGRKAVPHAHLLEFGTVKMPARPFLRPAALFMQERVAIKMIDILSKGVLREAKKLSGAK